ncbi:MAG TPA: DUF5343 domain-containing protein [Thermomicrobiales bacterium]|nr:DUF5343 domain-containing protein [Thermomicrobiales bacterium]
MLEAINPRPSEDERRPYAPAANVLGLLDRIRRRNLPETIDPDFMRIANIPEGSMGRVAATLRFLDLVDEAGRPTDQLRAMARADDDEYRALLGAVVREAYAADFARVDPAEDTTARIMSAFQRYEPRSQTARMVMLFLGLARAVGIEVLEAPRERQMRDRPTARATPVRTRRDRPQPTTAAPAVDPIRGAIPPLTGSLLFGVTIDDIGNLESQADFETVWSALGLIARARATSLKAARETAEKAAAQRSVDAGEGEVERE